MDEKIRIMQKGGKKLAHIRDKVLGETKVGIKTIDLDRLAEKLIREAGGKPSFKLVEGYNWATCICINDCIVHGVPDEYRLKKGDVVTIDVGMFYGGFHTDTASTIIVGQNAQDRFLTIGQKALNNAITQACVGKRIGHISQVIQQTIEKAGYNVVRTLVGHGIGRELHEGLQIPCFLEGKIRETPALKEGMTLAVEVIYMEGDPEVKLDVDDNWTIRTKDGSRSAMFEHTIAVTKNGPLILTK